MVVTIPLWNTITVSGITVDGEAWSNVYSFKSSAPITDPTVMLNLVNTFWTAMHTLYANIMVASESVTAVTARTHYSEPFIQAAATLFLPQIGANNVDPVPSNATEVISWKTGFIGRRYRGRNFMPPTDENSTLGDIFVSGYLGPVASLAARILTGFASGGVTLTPVIASRTGLVLTTITGFLVDRFIENMKDRLPRHHRHKKAHTV